MEEREKNKKETKYNTEVAGYSQCIITYSNAWVRGGLAQSSTMFALRLCDWNNRVFSLLSSCLWGNVDGALLSLILLCGAHRWFTSQAFHRCLTSTLQIMIYRLHQAAAGAVQRLCAAYNKCFLAFLPWKPTCLNFSSSEFVLLMGRFSECWPEWSSVRPQCRTRTSICSG